MMQNEKILALVILGIILSTFSVLTVQYSIQHEENKDKPMQMVKLDGNTTTRYEVQPPPAPPSIIVGMLSAVMKLAYAFPFAVAGFSLFVTPMGLLQTHLFSSPEGFRVLVVWIIAMISIPITFYLSKEITLWRRVLYIYVIAAIISGIPIMLSENFGQ